MASRAGWLALAVLLVALLRALYFFPPPPATLPPATVPLYSLSGVSFVDWGGAPAAWAMVSGPTPAASAPRWMQLDALDAAPPPRASSSWSTLAVSAF